MNYQLDQFPRQKLSDSKKGEEWYKECIDKATEILNYRNDYAASDYIRRSNFNKQANYKLRIGELSLEDVKSYLDPYELGLNKLPDTFRHIGRGNSYINLLIGEEIARGTNYKVYISSGDKNGISSKEEKMKEMILNQINESIQSGEIDSNQLKKQERYLKYEWQDHKELTASKILKAEFQKNRIDRIFTECFEDILTCGEEIMCSEIHGGAPHARRCNPLNVYTLSSGFSNKVEDSDIIVEYQYLSPGQVIDRYYDYLDERQISTIENRNSDREKILSNDYPLPLYGSESQLLILDPQNANLFNQYYDQNGNIRVANVNWRSRREIKKLKYFDEYGKEQMKYVHSEYIPNEADGEEVTSLWINEWWQGTKIGEDIYVNVKPIPNKAKSLINISKGLPNYIGQYYNTNFGKTISMVDITKPIDYTYDIVFWKRDQEIAKHFGNVLAINQSMVPSGWDPDMWLNYVSKKGIAWLDPTQEILKGPSQGKSAGMFNTLTAQNISGSTADSIKLYTEILLSLEDTLSKLTGVSPQRESQVHQSETLGGVQRSLNQSSHITEKWFTSHDEFKERFLTKHLETIKFCYKKNPQIAQYILDDIGLEIVSNYDEIVECDYDVHVTNATKDKKIIENIQQLAQAAIQNQQIKFSDIVSIFKSESTQDIARRMDQSAEEIAEQQRQNQEAINEHEAKLQEYEQEFNKYLVEKESLENQLDRENNIELALITKKNNQTTDNEPKLDPNVIAKLKEESKLRREELQKEIEENRKQRLHEKEENEKDRKNELAKIKAKPKPKPSKK